MKKFTRTLPRSERGAAEGEPLPGRCGIPERAKRLSELCVEVHIGLLPADGATTLAAPGVCCGHSCPEDSAEEASCRAVDYLVCSAPGCAVFLRQRS
eukprot:COSAG01_NODE_695_length_14201_cov_10.521875_7_plen_97_part_00